MKKRLPALILVSAAAAIGAWHFLARGGNGDPLVLYGNVDIREVDLAFRVGGRIESLAFDEGDRVAIGEPLATLDTEPLDEALAVAEAAVAQAEAVVAKLRAGTRAQELRRAEANLDEARAERARARRELERQQAMMADDATSERDLDRARTLLIATEARVRAAEETLSLLIEGPRVEDIAAAEAQLALVKAQEQQARTALADATLASPSAGTILTRIREHGAIVQAGQPVYTLSLDRPVRVRAYVDEPRLGDVAPGTRVTIHRDGRDAPYQGRVGFVSPRAEFTPKNVETEELRTDLVYRLRIIVTDADDGLRQGMPVTVRLPGAS